MKKIAFVIATKDRPDELRKMLGSLSEQSHRPDQVVIVDASADPVSDVAQEFRELNIKHIHHSPPSASAQRNIGIVAVDSDMELIGFLDDDIVLAPNALERTLKFWQTAPEDFGGCAFNLMNPFPRSASRLKESTLTRLLGLYSDKKGIVMPSGWQTLTGTVKDTTFVEWLPSGASVWRKEIFGRFRFDEFFDRYSYLEDLDFSYSVSRHYRLAIVADAKFWHYPTSSGRFPPYLFGKREISNRMHFVKKHKDLSISLCCLGLIGRFLLTVNLGILRQEGAYFKRALGNCVGGLFGSRTKKEEKRLAATVVAAEPNFKDERQKRVVILASAMGPTNRGIGQYQCHLLPELLSRLITLGFQVLVVISKDAPLPLTADGIKYIRLPIKRDNSAFKFLAEQFYVPLFSWGVDLFLSLESVFPFFPIKAKRKLVVVHDIHVVRHCITPEEYPEDYTLQYKAWAPLATRKAVSSSDLVITDSKFTGDEVRNVFGISPDRIIPILLGIDHKRYHLITDSGAIERVNKRYALPPSFYLFVGPYSKKKNLRLIVEAYASSDFPSDVFLPVVVVGDTRRSDVYEEVLQLIGRTHQKDQFLFLGFVPDRDMNVLYAAARAFIYPSLYEGFGLPALEAMACGTPVIASNQSSIPEVVAEAGILIDPSRPEELIDALRRVNDDTMRKALIDAGLERVKLFSWAKTAELMIEEIVK